MEDCTSTTPVYHVITVGDSGTGKTNLLLRFASDEFSMATPLTIGVEFKLRTITPTNGDPIYTIMAWDTAGQERYNSISQTYYRNARAALLVCSLIDKQSFTSLKTWSKNLDEYASADVVRILVATKCDAVASKNADECVAIEDLQQYAATNNIPLVVTSALTPTNVDTLFDLVAQLVAESNVQRWMSKQPPFSNESALTPKVGAPPTVPPRPTSSSSLRHAPSPFVDAAEERKRLNRADAWAKLKLDAEECNDADTENPCQC